MSRTSYIANAAAPKIEVRSTHRTSHIAFHASKHPFPFPYQPMPHAPSLTNRVTIDTASKTIVTQSKPSDFPSLLRQKLSIVQSVERHKVQTEAVVNETCEKCGRTEVRYSAVQLRSADEGSTIFYTCDCGHKYVVLLFLIIRNQP